MGKAVKVLSLEEQKLSNLSMTERALSKLTVPQIRDIAKKYNKHVLIQKFSSLPKDKLIKEVDKHIKYEDGKFVPKGSFTTLITGSVAIAEKRKEKKKAKLDSKKAETAKKNQEMKDKKKAERVAKLDAQKEATRKKNQEKKDKKKAEMLIKKQLMADKKLADKLAKEANSKAKKEAKKAETRKRRNEKRKLRAKSKQDKALSSLFDAVAKTTKNSKSLNYLSKMAKL